MAPEPEKHETASGELLVAWASGEGEGFSVEEWGPDRFYFKGREMGNSSVQFWLRTGTPWRVKVLLQVFPGIRGSRLWLEALRVLANSETASELKSTLWTTGYFKRNLKEFLRTL